MKSTRKVAHPATSNIADIEELPMKQPMSEIVVFIEAAVWAKLRHWIRLAGDDEVSCLGLIDEIKDDDRIVALIVSEIYLLEQTVSGADTEFEDKAVANLMIQLATERIDTSGLKCWIHSHDVRAVAEGEPILAKG